MSHIRWSCSTRGFALAPFDLAVRVVAGLQFRAVDLSIAAGSRHIGLAEVLADPGAAGEQVRRLLSPYALEIADLRLDTSGLDRPALRPLFAFAQRCQTPHVTLCWSMDQELELVSEGVRMAEQAGMRIALEASPGTSPDAIRNAARLLDVGLTVDHGAFLADGFPLEQVEDLLPMASHFRVRGTAPSRFQVAWSENTLDHNRIIEALRARGYTGFLAADYVWDPARGYHRTDTIAETVQMRRNLKLE